MAILPGTAERDERLVNSPHDQWDAAFTVEVAVGDPGDSPLDAVYAAINDDWTPADSLCVVAARVAEVQQLGATVTGRGDDRPVQRSTRIMVAVKYRTAAGRLTAT